MATTSQLYNHLTQYTTPKSTILKEYVVSYASYLRFLKIIKPSSNLDNPTVIKSEQKNTAYYVCFTLPIIILKKLYCLIAHCLSFVFFFYCFGA